MTHPAPQVPDKHLPQEKFRWRTQKQLHQMAQMLVTLCNSSTRGQIHDIRVLSRRLRAALSVLQRVAPQVSLEEQREALRQLTKHLGPVRSLDVTTQLMKAQLKLRPLGKARFDPVLEAIKKRRKKAGRALEKYECSAPYSVLWNFCMNKEILRNIDLDQFPLHLEQRLGKATRRLLKTQEKYDLHPKMSLLHQLRINLKKWRYLLEIRSDCVGPQDLEKMDQAKQIQDQLGRIHDHEVLLQELKTRRIKRVARRNALQGELKSFDRSIKSEITRSAQEFRQQGSVLLLQIVT